MIDEKAFLDIVEDSLFEYDSDTASTLHIIKTFHITQNENTLKVILKSGEIFNISVKSIKIGRNLENFYR